MPHDIYLTIEKKSEPTVFKDRKSKFIAYAFPVQNTEEIKSYIQQLKKTHHNARHWCYAYRLGIEKITERANDDGEPSNSAGTPILNQVKAKNLTNILVVVVRYFGGVKLGVGGLINAYKTATQLVLEQTKIIEKIRTRELEVVFSYNDINKVMRIIKENQLKIIKQNLLEKGHIVVKIRLDDYEKIKSVFEKNHNLIIKKRS